MFTGYQGAAKRLDNTDPSKIGAMIGVGEDEIHAFMDVEAGGSGFDAKNRVKMLFEPHIFYRELGATKKRAAAVKAGLAYETWKTKPYPKDSYPVLIKAMAIDETAALRSASWGLGQLMGFNHRAVGFQTPQKMVASFAADEENQLQAMVAFLKAKNLVQALHDHNWKRIEAVYNGGGYGGAYAVKLAQAYKRWTLVQDTPWHPAKQDPAPPELDALLTPESAKPEPAAFEEVHIEPASAEPDDRLRIKPKPIGKSRKVWSTIMGYVTGGGAGIFAAFQGFDWQTAAVIMGGLVFVGLVFVIMYRHEIRAGMFAPEKGK